MAIKWGPWTYVPSAGFDFRTGTDFTWSPTTVTSATTASTITTRVYFQCETYAYGSNARFEVTGDASGSGDNISWNLSGSSDVELIGTVVTVVPLAYGATGSHDIQARVRPSLTWGTYTAWASNSITVPARPYELPNAPTELVVSVSGVLSWINNPVSPSKPYTNVEVWRRELNGATGSWTSFVRIANLPGTTTSYADNTRVDNRKYEYKVRATNTSGPSGYSGTQLYSTTPSTPSAPAISKTSAGVVTIHRPNLSAVATHWEVWHAQQVGGVWTWDGARLASLTAATASYSYTPDPAYPHKYGVRAVSSSPILYSSRSPDSATVTLLTAPAAPTPVAPLSGAAFDATQSLVVSWVHNPIDLTAQTAYEVQWDLEGDTSWSGSTGKVTSTASSHTIPANTFLNGDSPHVRYRTYGAHASPSPWTEIVLNASSAPVVGIDWAGGNYPSPYVSLPVTYFDAEGLPMSRWRAELVRDGDIIENRSETGSISQLTFKTRLDDGATYTVRFWASDGVGMESGAATETLPVVYAVPAVPTLDVSWDPETGSATLTARAEPGGAVPTEYLMIVRAAEDGRGWYVVADQVSSHVAVTDPVPPLGTMVRYRAVAVSSLPSSTSSPDVELDTHAESAFINYGPGFSRVLRLSSNVTSEASLGRNRQRHTFARDEAYAEAHQGSTVTYSGLAMYREHVVSASLWAPWTSAEEDVSTETRGTVDELASSRGDVCVRDPLGTYLIGSVGRVTHSGIGDDEERLTIPLWEDESARPTLETI